MIKRFFLMFVMSALVALGVSSMAYATLIFQITAVQGGSSASTCAGGSSPCTGSLTVGDYTLSATGAFSTGANLSQASETNIQVQRTGTGSSAPLEVFLSVINYTLPTGPKYEFDTTHSATLTATSNTIPVSFQGWVDFNNVGFSNTPSGANLFTNGQIVCTPSGAGLTKSCSVDGVAIGPLTGGIPFSLTGETIFNIGQFDTTSIMTSGSQVIITAVTPEPSSMLLLGAGLIGLGAWSRRRIKHK